jgi:hypothetical protein
MRMGLRVVMALEHRFKRRKIPDSLVHSSHCATSIIAWLDGLDALSKVGDCTSYVVSSCSSSLNYLSQQRNPVVYVVSSAAAT